jgi:ubiquinone/menaquinone biosynthesis C-methylase UbiE
LSRLTIRYDEEPARRILALSDTEEMRAQRRRVLDLLAPQPGWCVLDVGCGPGHLARELAAAVGPNGRACGVDVSEHMLALAADHPEVELAHVSGTELPFADGAFDAACATQVYEFVQELPAALGELRRVLRAGGRALILDTDWDTLVWHSSEPARMQRVLDGWRRRVAHQHLPRTLGRLLREAGLELEDVHTYAIFDTEGREGSYSARQIEHLGASAEGVGADDVAAWAADLRGLAAAGEYFFSLNRYVFIARNPG